MKALLFELDLIPSSFTGEFAQPMWFMDEAPFAVSIIKSHPFSLRIHHYHVDQDAFECLERGEIDVADWFDKYDAQKVIHKELTTYGDIEKVYRLMYMNEWFAQPESESSVQVTA